MIVNLIFGICIGSIYAMMALSVAVVFRGTQKVNFAHGEMGALGVYVYLQWSVLGSGNRVVGAILGLLVAGASGVVFGLLARRMEGRTRDGLVPLIGSFGLYLVVRSLTVVWWGPHEPYELPVIFGTGNIHFDGDLIPYSYIGCLATTVGLGIVLTLLSRFTPIGLQLRALVAELAGLPTRRLEILTYFVGTAMAGVAAFLYFENASLIVGNVDIIVIAAFAIAAVGGFQNFGAIAAASLLFGVMSQFIERYANFPGQAVVSLGVLVCLLFIVPRGILVARSERYG
jgi:branched-subunit amino acid ABC-type transport system permease component